MIRRIAFLRGLNVGGHRVTMDRLRGLFVELGFRGVTTFIATGNVVFEGRETAEAPLRRRLEAHLERELGYAVPTVLRTPDELGALLEFEPFDRADVEAPGHSVQVVLLPEPPPAGLRAALAGMETPRDVFRGKGREIFWLSRGRLTDSLVPLPKLEKALGWDRGTMRNRSTLLKLQARLLAGGAG